MSVYVGEKDLLEVTGGAVVKNLPASVGNAETQVESLGREDALEWEMATHPSIPAWKIL